MGGTNALRAGGRWAGIFTGLGDMAKGFLAIVVARWIMDGSPNLVGGEVLAGIAAVIGHNASIYLGFRGGAALGRTSACASRSGRSPRCGSFLSCRSA